MCEVCESRARCDKLMDEVDFRIVQYQKERDFGNPKAQKDARQRAMSALEEVFIELDRQPELEKMVTERMGAGLSLGDLLSGKKPPQTH